MKKQISELVDGLQVLTLGLYALHSASKKGTPIYETLNLMAESTMKMAEGARQLQEKIERVYDAI